MPPSRPTPTPPPDLWDRPEMAKALAERDMGQVLKIYQRWTGASQTQLARMVDVGQPTISGVIQGKRRVETLSLFERFASGLGIPRARLGLSEDGQASPAPASTPPLPLATVTDSSEAAESDGAQTPAGEIEDRRLAIDIEVAEDGWATLTYRRELFNGTEAPLTRMSHDLWFETTNGPLKIEALPSPDRNVLIQRIHDTALNARFACQIFPAIEPGESAEVGYRSTGGRFVYDHYWRQAIPRPTGLFVIRLRHHGITTLERCSATEDRPDGVEISATESLSWTRDADGVVIELTRRNLRPNQAVTLRWDGVHAAS